MCLAVGRVAIVPRRGPIPRNHNTGAHWLRREAVSLGHARKSVRVNVFEGIDLVLPDPHMRQ